MQKIHIVRVIFNINIYINHLFYHLKYILYFIALLKTCHGLQVPAAKYTGAKGDIEPEDEEYERIYYPWLSWNLNSTNHVVDRNGDLVGGLHENINHEIYKNIICKY
jgi:hypothetical protein